jgi:Putative MetA-pathway of phenol degradation
MRRAFGVMVLIVLVGAPASAQQRPLVTEDPETIGSGIILIEAGLDYARDVLYPVSGLQGNLIRWPTIGMSLGVGSIVEIQLDWAPYQRLEVTDRFLAPLSSLVDFEGDSTSDVDDLVVATKLRFLSEAAGRPALGLRFATKLPLASNESGLGLDTIDVSATALIGKTIQSIRVVGNVGFAILGDPTRGDRQNDALVYGFSVARAIAQGFEVVGEVNGRAQQWGDDPPPGTESRALMRIGTRYTRGSARVDGGLLVGLTSSDPSWGLTAGVTWVFRGFTVP